MTVSPYSLAAYDSVDLPERRRDVLEAIVKLGRCNDEQIAEHLDWKINRVTPRRGELEQHNLIGLVGSSTTKAGRVCGVYEAKSADGYTPIKKLKTASQRLKIALKALNDISMLSKDKLILNIADGALRDMEK